MAPAGFAYTPLDRSSRSIRLVQFALNPRSNFHHYAQPIVANEIHCRMQTYSVAECPPFVALSYCWGTDDPAHTIHIDGRPFRIRQNLWDALSKLQSQLCRPRRGIDAVMPAIRSLETAQDERFLWNNFWIDALCINQDDDLERGHQVNMMKEIFSVADSVIAWVGLEYEDSEQVFSTGLCSDPRDKVFSLLGLVLRNAEPFAADYTASIRQIYCRALAYVRNSPNLVEKESWDTLRETLRLSMGIPLDDDYGVCDFVYEMTEGDRPKNKPLSRYLPQQQMELAEVFLKSLVSRFKDLELAMGGDASTAYRSALDRFSTFPRHEDPEAWNCFDKLLKQSLGLETDEDESLFSEFTHL